MGTQKQNIIITRGDEINVENYNFRVLGDYSSDIIKLTITEDTDLTSVRYVDVTLIGTYNGVDTLFSGVIPKENLQGVDYNYMVYDIVKNEEITLITGIVKLLFDIRTPYNGLPLEEDNLRYVLVDSSEFNENDFIYFNGTDLVNISANDAGKLLCKENFITKTIDIYNLEEV